jgi:hypothetical protein
MILMILVTINHLSTVNGDAISSIRFFQTKVILLTGYYCQLNVTTFKERLIYFSYASQPVFLNANSSPEQFMYLSYRSQPPEVQIKAYLSS